MSIGWQPPTGITTARAERNRLWPVWLADPVACLTGWSDAGSASATCKSCGIARCSRWCSRGASSRPHRARVGRYRRPDTEARLSRHPASPAGLFVPKPTSDADCQDGTVSNLGHIVHLCPLASIAGGGDWLLARFDHPADLARAGLSAWESVR